MSKVSYQRISDFERFEENPSLKDLQFIDEVVDEDAVVEKVYNKDTAKFTKIFEPAHSNLQLLSSTGLRVLVYFFSVMKPNKDTIIFSINDCKKYTGYTSNVNVYRGLGELLNKQFLFRIKDVDTMFFLNVNYFFNGRREKLFV